MARVKLREYDAKHLLGQHLKGVPLAIQNILITPETNLKTLPSQHPWLLRQQLVVKPDQLFGKRKKLNLVLANASWEEVTAFLLQHRNKEIAIGRATDILTHFLIEPFIPHEQEYYLAFSSVREGDIIYFSKEGGVDIEEQWQSVRKAFVPALGTLEGSLIPELLQGEQRGLLFQFITQTFRIFRERHFTYLEFNPFTITDNKIFLLDAVALADSSAAFPGEGQLEFPREFGRKYCREEENIKALDQESGASLKLTVLNPQGRIWNILSGGGASIIYLDTIAGLGKQEEIANYGEYSGNPTAEESYQYAKTILELMTREHHPRGKVLIIGGAIANFTDVEKTFTGIIRALKECQGELREGKVSVFVRRGGPNYERGLRLMQQAGKEIGIPMLVQGPDAPMVELVGKAMEKI